MVPQVLEKAPVPAKPPLDSLPGVQAQIQRAHQELGDDALINVRYSGTEPVVRVMIQGADHEVDTLRAAARQILSTVTSEIPQHQEEAHDHG
jgi:phosphoglucosamine mutase